MVDSTLRAALLLALPAAAMAQPDEPVRLTGIDAKTRLERVEVVGIRPATMPTEIPTTTQSISGQQIERTINATDSQDALKYFPSLNMRERYIGDDDQAVLATRASGTGNSTRSLGYADGILLSKLLGNGASWTPRWGLVTPEEIDRVDVSYGPFSAAYSGNSAGRPDNTGQPIAFANKLVSADVVGNAGTPVTGAIADRNAANQDWLILGDTNRIHTVQDHAKLKLAFDFSSGLRASYTLGVWTNDAEREVGTCLRVAASNAVYGSSASPKVNIGGRDYTLSPSDFAPSRGQLEHVAHGLSVKSNTRGIWDWETPARVSRPSTATPR